MSAMCLQHPNFLFGLLLSLLQHQFGVVTADSVTDIYLIGLFPLSGPWKNGQGVLPAAQMAVEDINNRSDILPGYRLNMEAYDTKCDSGLGIKTVADKVCQLPAKIMIIGAGCSPVSQAVAEAAHHWNLVQISYASLSPALSNKEKYPNFFRLVASERALNEARMALLKHFNWTRVATIYEDHHIFSMLAEDLTERLTKGSYKIEEQVGFSVDPETAVKRLKVADARIIVGGFYADKARKVFCAAYNNGFYGKQVWITSATLSLDSNWWKERDPSINCTRQQMEQIVQNMFIVYNVYTNIDVTEEGLTGMSVQRFWKTYETRTKNMTQPVSGAERAPAGYDAVWAAAIALNKTIDLLEESGNATTLADFSYDDKKMSSMIRASLQDINFTSVSGRVAFNQNGDGIRLAGIQMIQGSELVRVGVYDNDKPEGEKLTINDIWKGCVPKDAIQKRTVVISLSVYIYIAMTTLAGLGIFLALIFLSFNIHYRKVRVIQMSSPNINNIILVGCVLAYVSVFIADINVTYDSIYCKIRNALQLQGFSLSFGALFAKTWRVYTIITATRQFKTLKARTIKDDALILMIFGLVCLNSVVLCVWFVVDPQTVVTKTVSDKVEIGDDVITHYAYNYCSSVYQNYFLVTILVIQGIFLLLGIFLAWETRKVKLTILNESRYIGMCIYNIVVLGIVGVLVSYSVTQSTSFLYIIISSITILCTTVTQCLLFVPKVLAYMRFAQGKLNDGSLSNVTDEFNVELPKDKECQTDLMDKNWKVEV